MEELTDEEWDQWRGFLRWSEDVKRAVADEVTRASGLSFPDFEVLVRLHVAGGEVGQRELQASLDWSASRCSHQLARMERRGQVSRSEVGEGRLVRVALTEAGAADLEPALARHALAVRRYFLGHLSVPLRSLFTQQHGPLD